MTSLKALRAWDVSLLLFGLCSSPGPGGGGAGFGMRPVYLGIGLALVDANRRGMRRVKTFTGSSVRMGMLTTDSELASG